MNFAGRNWWPFAAAARQRYRFWNSEWSARRKRKRKCKRDDTGFLKYEELLVSTVMGSSGTGEPSPGSGVGDDTVEFLALVVEIKLAMVDLQATGCLREVEPKDPGNVRCETCRDYLCLAAVRTGKKKETYRCLECARQHRGRGTLMVRPAFHDVQARALQLLELLDRAPRGKRAPAGLSGRDAAFAEARGPPASLRPRRGVTREEVVGWLLGQRAVLEAASRSCGP